MVDKKFEDQVTQFTNVTGASSKDARKFLEKYKRLDVAIDSYYNDPNQFGGRSSGGASTTKLNALFDKYKDSDDEEITVEGTIKFCEDMAVDPEDVVLLAVAFELKSPRMGHWTRQGWIEGWKNIGVDTIDGMSRALPGLKSKLGSDADYFQKVYSYTFDFARAEGQRSLALDSAQALWGLLIPHGLEGGAIRTEGWQPEFTQLWFDFLNGRGGKGVSKDTWIMFLDFVRSIDSKFEKYDMEAAWPSTIDDFVEYAGKKVKP
ncbi:hypothetical protein AX16_001574 [Volvariella volvacea WC 439]|nr:hypothetical protein AX16_001574 [Volvariella volvacea WC 439]